MMDQFAEILKILEGFWTQYYPTIVAGLAVMIPTIVAIVKTKLSNMFKSKLNKVTEQKDELSEALLSKFQKAEDDRTNDMRALGEAFNTAFANSNLAPEHKMAITSQLNNLSGVSSDMANTLKAQTKEIISTTEVPESITNIQKDINESGSSLLNKFMNELIPKEDE